MRSGLLRGSGLGAVVVQHGAPVRRFLPGDVEEPPVRAGFLSRRQASCW